MASSEFLRLFLHIMATSYVQYIHYIPITEAQQQTTTSKSGTKSEKDTSLLKMLMVDGALQNLHVDNAHVDNPSKNTRILVKMKDIKIKLTLDPT